MKVLILYDISNNKIRNKIVKLLIDMGLTRVQLSVFLGETSCEKLDEFMKETSSFVNLKTDSIHIAPLCKKDFNNIIFLGKPQTIDLYKKHFIFF